MATVYDNSQWNRSALVLFTLLLFPHPEAGFVPSLIIDGVPMWKHSFITKDCFFPLLLLLYVSSKIEKFCTARNAKCNKMDLLGKKGNNFKKHIYNIVCTLGPDRLESIILKIIDKKIYNPPSHLQSIIPENYRFFAYYSGKL